MTAQFRLNEKDIKQAINSWMKSRGNQPACLDARIYLGIDPGDPPLSLPTVYATASFEVEK